MFRKILDQEFHVTPFYRLREWNVLTQKEKELISALHDESEVYGTFSPADPESKLTAKLAYHELALVYLHLSQSTFLPHYLRASNEDRLNQAMARLVLDRVLEIKWEENFVSGIHASKALFGDGIYNNRETPGFIALLTNRAIDYVLHLEKDDIRTIGNRLYTYNTMPLDSSLRKKFVETDLRDFVFSALSASTISSLNKEWHLIGDRTKDYWLGWTRNFSSSPLIPLERSIYKLYISPAFKELPKVMNIALPALTSSDAFSFKFGNSIAGLLRPDKMVAYFESKSSLLELAAELKDNLTNCEVHGVPFTAQLDDKGILSWGVDPPGSDVLNAIEGGSWRCKVTDQVALAVMQLRSEQVDHAQSMEFIKSKLFVAGIDPHNWTALN